MTQDPTNLTITFTVVFLLCFIFLSIMGIKRGAGLVLALADAMITIFIITLIGIL